MKVHRIMGIAALSLLVIAGPAMAAAASTTSSPPRAAGGETDALSTVPAEIAVRGFNDHLYSRGDQQSSFRDLGGRIISTPAVGYSSTTGRLYFVAIGTDHSLWVRTDKAPWQRLVVAHNACNYSPAVSIDGNSFVVACTGQQSKSIYSGSQTLPADGTAPMIQQLDYQDGSSYGSPALSRSGSTTYLWMIYRDNNSGQMYMKALSGERPPGVYLRQNELCVGQPGVAGIPGDHFYLGCQHPSTSTQHSKVAYYVGDRSGLAGQMRGPVGVARAYDKQTATLFVTDLHGAVWSKNLSPAGSDSFVKLGGDAQPGVAATLV